MKLSKTDAKYLGCALANGFITSEIFNPRVIGDIMDKGYLTIGTEMLGPHLKYILTDAGRAVINAHNEQQASKKAK